MRSFQTPPELSSADLEQLYTKATMQQHQARKAIVRENLKLLGFWILRLLVVVIWVGCVWGFISTYF